MVTKNLGVKAALVFLSIMLSLGLTEIVCRTMLAQPGYTPLGSGDPPGLWALNDARGYAYAKQFAGTVERESFAVEISTGTLGLRTSPEEIRAAAPSQIPVLAVGDSFTFGWGVDYEQAWPEQLDHILKSQSNEAAQMVVNAGVSGYSLRQIRLLTEELVPLLRPKVVIVGVWPNAMGRLQDPYVLYNGGIVQESSLPKLRPATNGWLYTPMYQPWLKKLDFWLDENWWSAAYALKGMYNVRNYLTEENRKRLETPGDAGGKIPITPLLQELELIRNLLAENQEKLLVLDVVGQAEDGGFSRREIEMNSQLLEWCKASDVACVDMLSVFNQHSSGKPVFRIPGDGHWSAIAHRLAAEQLAQHLDLKDL